jgi:hypothetical protein
LQRSAELGALAHVIQEDGMRRVLLLAAVLLASVVAGCATPLVIDHDYDTTYDFSKLRTYAWLPSPPGNQMEDMTEKRVQGAVNNQLQTKGYSQTNESPDFLVAVEGIKKTVTAGSVGVGASVAIPVGGRGALHVGGGRSQPRTKEEGTLNVNIVDAKTQTVIWKGMASAALQPKKSPEEQQQRINQVVAELLKSFPPGKSK